MGKGSLVQGIKARWIMPPPMPSGYDASLKHLSPVVAQILYNRGLAQDELPAFLRPEAVSMHAPLLMHGMADAVRRIRSAIAAHEKIIVYGDFDVDGMTASVLLYEVITALGANADIYVPRRHTEGYGLNAGAIERLAADGARLIVTVDCGIGSVAEVARARELGIDVIVTDHHLPPTGLPQAVAILNPHQPLCSYPFKELAGVGVAFKLASALLDGVPNGHRLRHDVLDLVAIGTVSDMVPLRGENRVLVRYGLPLLTHTRRIGLQALMRRAGLEHDTVTTADIGFQLAPRLNAAGRLDHAMIGCRLLLAKDAAEADVLAADLERQNDERKRQTALILEEARHRIGAHPRERAIVIDDSGWTSGVAGLVAGRLADEYCRPVFVIERSEGESKGSARSIPGFNVVEALRACHGLLTKYGGHAQAAGFSLDAALIPDFRDQMTVLAAQQLSDDDLVPTIELDAEIGGRDFDATALHALHEQLSMLEPFGTGNRPPVLMWRNLRVAECRLVGANKHLRLTLLAARGTINAIAFGQANDVGVLPRGAAIDVVFSLQYNEWNGYAGVELRVKDVAVKGDTMRHVDHAPQVTSA